MVKIKQLMKTKISFRTQIAKFIFLGFLIWLLLPLVPIVTIEETIRSKEELALESFSEDTADFEKLDDNIIQYMEIDNIPSLTAAIVQDSTVVWAKGYGAQPAVDLIYIIGSITKTFTSTAVFQLYEQGLIDLEDDVNNYLPFELRNPNYPDAPITFRMLLSHRSSLNATQSEYYDFIFQDLARKLGATETYPPLSVWLEEHFSPNGSFYNPNIWHSWAPGAGFLYSNTGFGILGYLIELISNQSLEEYFLDHIFSPLNMVHSGYNFSKFDLEKLAIPYDLGVTDGQQIPLPQYNEPPLGCGGLRTSVLDLSHFLIAHMNAGIYNGVRILEEESIELMHQKGLGSYGLGWSWNSRFGSAQGHSGLEVGFISHMYFIEGTSMPYGAILLINKVWSDAIGHSYAMFDLLLEAANRSSSNIISSVSSSEVISVNFIGSLNMISFIALLSKRKNLKKKI